SGSQKGRTSILPSRAMGCLAATSVASSKLAHSSTSKPAIHSLVSANGPSVVRTLPFRLRTVTALSTPARRLPVILSAEARRLPASQPPSVRVQAARGLTTAGTVEWQRPEADGRAGRQSPIRLHVVVGPRDHGASGPGRSSVDLTIGVSMFVGPARSSQICWPANYGTEIAKLTILAG